nr:metallothionein-3-like [Leptinotarsa decemlineata]
MSSASESSCCNKMKTSTVTKMCKLKTAEGLVDCECICKCTRDVPCKCNGKCDGDCKSSECASCNCECECTMETAKLGDDGKYRCECACVC